MGLNNGVSIRGKNNEFNHVIVNLISNLTLY